MAKNQVDELLELAASQIRETEPDPQGVEQAAARVWARLSSSEASTASSAAEVTEIRGCEDYQALIPAFLAGSLPQARKILVDEHTRECVPCRRALLEAREGKPARPTPRRRETTRVIPFPAPVMRWALAAALVAGIGATLYFVSGMVLYGGTSAVVQTADAELFKVTESGHLPLKPGDEIREGEVIRSGRGGGAVVRLDDGSLVEMRERSELRVKETRGGTTIDLERGSVIVQAAEQRRGHLYVSTDDCLVSVTGTIFSVNHGTKGSRVSVVEGEVHVKHGGKESILWPGDQIATQEYLAAIPVEKEIAWSRDVDRYVALLQELAELRREIEKRVPAPGLRYSSRLLDLVPEDTVFYAAIPNLGPTIAETQAVLNEQLDKSPLLREWWQQHDTSGQFGELIDGAVSKITELSEYLGAETVVTGQMSFLEQEFGGPLVLAEVKSAAGIEGLVEELEAKLEEELQEEIHGEVVFLDDPHADAPEASFYVWLTGDLLAASPKLEPLRRVAEVTQGASNPFVGSDFYRQLAALYEDGAELIVAVDFEEAIRTTISHTGKGANGGVDALERLGVLNAQHLLFEQKHVDKTYYRASLTFKDSRRGLASWLAEPAPMGALQFISPDARFVAAFVVEDPVKLFDDIATLAPEGGQEIADLLADVESRFGFNLRDDFAASLGGEFAFAFDGPLVPTPAWKVVIEVYDPARFQWTLEQSLAEVNTLLAQEGKEPIEITQEEVGGRTYYSVPTDLAEVHYTYADGYLVMVPNRGLLDQALRFQKSGYSIVDAERFRALLPADGRNNFSALVYQDLASVFQEALKLSSVALNEEQKAALEEILGDRKPTLGYVYGERDRIVFAAASDNDVMLSVLEALAGLKSPLGLSGLTDLASPLGNI